MYSAFTILRSFERHIEHFDLRLRDVHVAGHGVAIGLKRGARIRRAN